MAHTRAGFVGALDKVHTCWSITQTTTMEAHNTPTTQVGARVAPLSMYSMLRTESPCGASWSAHPPPATAPRCSACAAQTPPPPPPPHPPRRSHQAGAAAAAGCHASTEPGGTWCGAYHDGRLTLPMVGVRCAQDCMSDSMCMHVRKQPHAPRAIVQRDLRVVLAGILRLHQLHKRTGGVKPRSWVKHGQPAVHRGRLMVLSQSHT